MADNSWYYTQGKDRKGRVTAARLKAMADEGWLTPKDLVWKEGMPDWVPADKVRGLFGNALVQKLKEAVDGVVSRPADDDAQRTTTSAKPQTDASTLPAPVAAKANGSSSKADWLNPTPRHLLAGCGGLALVAAGIYGEIGWLLGQAIENIGKASREDAIRRQEFKKLTVEKQPLDLEAKWLAHEQAALQQVAGSGGLSSALQPGTMAPQAPGGNVVVINQPPVQRWSLGLAAVLSFFVPGLRQLYKGQILNGVVWFFLVGFGHLALIVPGFVLHLFCILGALSGNPWTEGKTTVVRQ